MLKITAEEIHFIIYQYLHESGKNLPSPSRFYGFLHPLWLPGQRLEPSKAP